MLCLWLFRLAPCFFSVFPFSLFSLVAALPLSLSLYPLSSVAVALERFACAFSLLSRQISSSCSNSVVVAAAACLFGPRLRGTAFAVLEPGMLSPHNTIYVFSSSLLKVLHLCFCYLL